MIKRKEKFNEFLVSMGGFLAELIKLLRPEPLFTEAKSEK